jgi:hypothetical protein
MVANDELLRRVERLEAIEAIHRLKHQYLAYADDNFNPDGIASLFTEDAVWDGEAFGRYVGREAIRKHFRDDAGDFLFCAHLASNPIIDIDGPDEARGKWRMLMLATMRTNGQKEARWFLCAYDEEYRRVSGKWLFKKIISHANFFAPHGTGWADLAVA